MAAVQAEDGRDLNGHHQEWLGSTTTTVMEWQPLTLQLSSVAIGWLSAQPNARGGTLDLLMTDVPDLCSTGCCCNTDR